MNNKRAEKRALIVLLGVALILLPGLGYSDIPKQINYQGYLTNASGAPVNGTEEIVFSIYTAATGGSPLWTETKTVDLARGIFNVILGDSPSNPLTLPFDNPYYLGIKVGADPEMIPRQPLTSAGYAVRAQTVETIGPHNHSAGDITSGSLNLSGATGTGTSAIIEGMNTGAGYGVKGYSLSNWGVYGYSSSTAGVYGYSASDAGIEGINGSTGNFGRLGTNDYGVYGEGASVNGYAGYFTGRAKVTGDLLVDGGVGIGISSSPGTKLEVGDLMRVKGPGTPTWPGSGQGMELAYSTGQNKGYIQVYNRSAAPGVNPWGNLYLGDGNVGIGNGYPGAKLEVLTSAANSTGLYSRATSTGSATNYGGHFEAAGEDSYAVYGLASEASNFGQNFGGFFKAQGRAGIGVRGETTGNNGYGVLGVAAGTYGTGVSGTHSSGNTARLGTASYAGDFQGNVNISGNIFRSISGGSYGTLPVAFGGIDGWGDVFSSDMTGNYSVYRNCDQRRYEVSIEGENYDDRYYVTLITLTGADYSPVRIAQTRSEENKLLIYLKDIWGSNQLVCDQNDLHSFHFIVYKQ